MAYQGALPVPGNVIKMTFTWTESGGIKYGSRFFLGFTGGPPSSADLGTMATQCGNGWTTSMKTYWPQGVTLQSTTALDMSSRSGVQVIHPVGTTGAVAGAAVEAGAAMVLRFNIGQHYRGGHPKTFLPPLDVGQVVQPSSWNATALGNVQTGWNAMIANIMSGVYSSCALSGQVSVSWYEGQYPNPDPSPWAPKNVPKYRTTPQIYAVQSVTATPLIGSMRRRRQSTGA